MTALLVPIPDWTEGVETFMATEYPPCPDCLNPNVRGTSIGMCGRSGAGHGPGFEQPMAEHGTDVVIWDPNAMLIEDFGHYVKASYKIIAPAVVAAGKLVSAHTGWPGADDVWTVTLEDIKRTERVVIDVKAIESVNGDWALCPKGWWIA